TPAGSGTARIEPVAIVGPLLTTVAVMVSGEPTSTGWGWAATETARSAGLTGTERAAGVLSGVGAIWAAETGPGARSTGETGDRTTRKIVAVRPGSRLGMSTSRVPLEIGRAVPTSVLTEMTLTLAGTLLSSLRLVAVAMPAFVTLIWKVRS